MQGTIYVKCGQNNIGAVDKECMDPSHQEGHIMWDTMVPLSPHMLHTYQ